MNKLFSIAGVSAMALGVVATAQAADLPARAVYKAPAAVQPLPYNWSGFYIGANAGYGWARASASVTGTGGFVGDASEDLDGGVFGVQAGYNWQIGRTVIGVETDFQGSTQKASETATCAAATCGTAVTATRDSKLPWFGTTRLRLGYAFDRVLPYVTAGVEVGLTPNWSAKVEYLYLDSGTVTTTATVNGYGTVTEDERLKNNIVRGGINYRF
jgi:outer membrane immunogenic protein